MKSHILSQLSGVFSGIAAMSFFIDSAPINVMVFISSTILSFVFLFWSDSEQENEN